MQEYLTLSSVNVQASPSSDDVVVNTLVSGRLIEKIGESGNWIEVRRTRCNRLCLHAVVGPRERKMRMRPQLKQNKQLSFYDCSDSAGMVSKTLSSARVSSIADQRVNTLELQLTSQSLNKSDIDTFSID